MSHESHCIKQSARPKARLYTTHFLNRCPHTNMAGAINAMNTKAARYRYATTDDNDTVRCIVRAKRDIVNIA